MDEYIPKINNYYLNIINIRNNNTYGISKHEIPYTQNNKLENIGRKTPSYNIECVFMDNPPITNGWSVSEAIFPTYEAHKGFDYLINNTLEPLVFTHPKLGEINVFIENYNTYYDDTINYAKYTIDIVQEITTKETKYENYVVPEMANKWRETNETTSTKIFDSQKFTSTLNKWNAEAQLFINKLDSWLAGIESPLKSIINTVNYTSDLPSQVLSAINSTIDRIVQSYVDTRNVPFAFINNCIFGIRQLIGNFTGLEAQYIHIMGASRVGYEAGVQYDVDDNNRAEIDKKENIETWDYAGNYRGDVVLPVSMSYDELESSLYEVRKFINEAVQLDRNNRPLQAQAAFLLTFINRVKLDRERIRTITVPKQSLFQVLNNNKLRYNAIERILKLNPGIKNPNFSTGDIKILAD